MKIIAFPKDTNPYQELLYAKMRTEQGDSVRYLSPSTPSATINLCLFMPKILFWRLAGYNFFHLHWTTGFASKWKSFSYYHYLLCLKFIHLLGYKLVWTAHNDLPHEAVFPNDIIARRKLVETTDLVIAHSATTIEELKKIAVIPKKFVIIPHGSYIDVYPNLITRDTARKMLNLKQSDFVYLYLGQIREYKGIDDLLIAYNQLNHPHKKLIIAGQCQDPEMKRRIERAIMAGIVWHDQYINETDLQIYFAATDVVVLPFRKVTTSGSALLALSFGRSVILPSLGDLINLPNSIVYRYTPGNITALKNAMKSASENPDQLRRKSEGAKEYAKTLSWSTIARQTHDALQQLIV